VKIVDKFPPNYSEIKAGGLSDENSIFCYGDIIYNPKGKEIPIDIHFHEEIHSGQQKLYASPQFWWFKYIHDKEFRKSQEEEAFSKQYNFVKKLYKNKEQKQALDEFATILSSKMYKLDITKSQAETIIRHKAKLDS
jgi:hypothetical protein